MSARLFRLLLCAAVLGLLFGCASGFKQPDPVKLYYALKPERSATTEKGAPAPLVLKVKRINLVPSYSSRELVYRTAENVFLPDYYNLFLVAPKDMLTQTLRDWLDGAGVARVTLAGDSELEPDYVLESSFSKLYADYANPKTPAAVVEAQFFLLKDVQGRYEVVMSKTYRRETPLKDRSPETLVKGYDQSLAGIFQELEADLRGVLTWGKSAGKK